jgi:hypothetical protein
MKTADHRNAGIPDAADEVVGPKDHITRALDRAEKGQRPAAQQLSVVNGPDWRQGLSLVLSMQPIVPPANGVGSSVVIRSAWLAVMEGRQKPVQRAARIHVACLGPGNELGQIDASIRRLAGMDPALGFLQALA